MAAISRHNAHDSSLVQLRTGTMDAPLFLFSGGDGDPRSFTALACRVRNSKALIGVDFCEPGGDGQLASTVEMMAARSCSAIRSRQDRGPYYLVGYSFGGLVAVEVARLLQESGEEIALLGLIDTLFDQGSWPTRIFLRSQARLIRRHLAIALGLPPNQVIRMLFHRSQRLFLRVVRRQLPSSLTISTAKAEAITAIEQHCRALLNNYRPKHYAGKIICFDAENHDDFGCHPVELWRGMAREIECLVIPGTHVGVLTDSASLIELAAALDSKLAARLPPGMS